MEVTITSLNFVLLHLPVSGAVNVLPEGIYCCFTGTTCTIVFTVITLVC